MSDEIIKIKKDDKDVELIVVRPNSQQENRGKAVYAKAFSEALKRGDVFRKGLETKFKEQNILSEADIVRYQEDVKKIQEKEKVLANEEGNVKLEDAKQAALEMMRLRNKLWASKVDLGMHDSLTIEGQAENAQFIFLLQQCTVYNNNKREKFFKTIEDCETDSNQEAAIKASIQLNSLLYGNDSDILASLPENQFLHDYNFMNDEYSLINKDGHVIDIDGNLIEKEESQDTKKKKRKPFLDADGNPVKLPPIKKKT